MAMPSYFLTQRHMGTPKYAQNFSCVSYANPRAPKGGTLTIAASKRSELAGAHGFFGLDTSHEHYAFGQLMWSPSDDKATVYPYIARLAEVHSQGKGVTFYLNPQAQFHDGSPITASDILYTFHLLRRRGPPQVKMMMDDVETISKKSQKIVQFIFKKPNYDLPFYLSQMPILSKKSGRYEVFQRLRKQGKLLGSGPYQIKVYDRKKHLYFQKIRKWWGADLPIHRGLHNFHNVRILYFANTHAGFEAFKKGALDWWKDERISNWYKGYNFKAAEDGRIIRRKYLKPFFHGLTGIFINTRRAALKDVRTRQALNLMFNFHWMNRSLFFNQYERNQSIFMNTGFGSKGYATHQDKKMAKHFHINVDEISQTPFISFLHTEKGFSSIQKQSILNLLQDAGWYLKNGVLINQEGQPLKLRILVFAQGHKKIFENYLSILKAFGIDAHLKGGDPASYLSSLRRLNYDLVLHFHPHVSIPGEEQTLFWGSMHKDTHGTLNLSGVDDKHVDGLVLAISKARDVQTLKKLTSLLDRIIQLGYYLIPGWAPQYNYVAHWRHIRSKGDSASLYSTDSFWAQ